MNNSPLHSSIDLASIEKKLTLQKWEEFDEKNIAKYLKKMSSQITEITEILPLYFLRSPKNEQIPFNFFRVRNFSDITNPTLRSEYSYPPASVTTKNLRANLIGHPVFYSSNSPLVALLEYLDEWQKEDTFSKKVFAISKWELKNTKEYFVAPYISEELESINEFSITSKFTNQEFRQKANNNLNDEGIDKFRALKEVFASLFISDDNRSISSYLAHYSLYCNPVEPPIFLYPSVKSGKGEVNFALHPNFVDENMLIKRIWKVEVNSIKKVGIDWTFKYKISDQFGYCDKGYIKWTTIKGNEEQIRKDFREDFKHDIDLKTA